MKKKPLIESISQLIEEGLGLDHFLQVKIFQSIFALILVLFLRYLVRKFFEKKYLNNLGNLYRAKKVSNYIFYLTLFLIVGRIWFSGFESIVTYLGLLSAGLAVALKDPLVNIIGWFIIIWRGPFEVGDRVEIGNIRGDVIDIDLFEFHLLETGNWAGTDASTGRVLHIPNSKIFSDFQANFDQPYPFIWDEIKIVVTFESDWKKTQKILESIAKKHGLSPSLQELKRFQLTRKKQYMIPNHSLIPQVFVAIDDHGPAFTMRYVTRPRERRSLRHHIFEEILNSFAQEPHIDFAYPTQRFYNNQAEGKASFASSVPS